MSRNVGIILTIVTVLCCACPGFGICIAGLMGIAGVPFTTTVGTETTTEPMSTPVALALMCLSVILIIIPVAVGFYAFRTKPAAAAVPAPQDFNSPIPPAS
jgi:hypothetical protein